MNDFLFMEVGQSLCNLHDEMLGIILFYFTNQRGDIASPAVFKDQCEVSFLLVKKELASVDDVGVFQCEI